MVGIQANVVILWVIIIAFLGGWGCGAESDSATEDQDVLADTSEASSPSSESTTGASEQDAPQLVMDAPTLLDGEDSDSNQGECLKNWEQIRADDGAAQYWGLNVGSSSSQVSSPPNISPPRPR